METTITISDLNAGLYTCTTSTAIGGTINITYVNSDAPITLTNS